MLTVATVRPETMLADTAVAVHPDDERYRDLVGEFVTLPLVGRRLPIIADEHVDPEFGTGALKITPGHDPNDFEIGRRHGLEEISVIGEDGRMNEAPASAYAGMTAAEASAAVVAALREQGLLRGEQPYEHSVPFSERSGERIEPLISLQWFCRMEELAAPAIEVVERDEVRIVPENYKRVYLDWMRNIRPVVRLAPALVGAPDPGLVRARRRGDRRRVGGARAPKQRASAASTPTLWRRRPTSSTPGSARRSGRSRRSAGPTDTPHLRAFYPTSFLTTAREIIFLWVARMVMMGIEFAGDIPFRDVYVHPVVQAPRRTADVEVARHRDRPARRDRGPRRRRAALRAARDVLDPGRPLLATSASSRAATSRTRCGTPRG